MTDLAHKLRPAKVRTALRRRWFEHTLSKLPLDPGPPILSLGTEYGAWEVPEGVLGPEPVCWSIGAGGDISFDLELIRRYGARVRSFDPVEEFGRLALQSAAGEPRFSFVHAAITTADGPVRMQLHHEPGTRSVSSAGLYDSVAWVEAPGRTIRSLMSELGDDRIDLLKVDVEGAEYELLPTLDLVAMGVRVFAVQLHHTGSVRDARRLVGSLRDQGFKPVALRSVVKVTFLRDR
jgi:FkbM family methyltransferase